MLPVCLKIHGMVSPHSDDVTLERERVIRGSGTGWRKGMGREGGSCDLSAGTSNQPQSRCGVVFACATESIV